MKIVLFVVLVLFVGIPVLGSLDSAQAGGDPKGALFNGYENPYPYHSYPLMAPNGNPYNP